MLVADSAVLVPLGDSLGLIEALSEAVDWSAVLVLSGDALALLALGDEWVSVAGCEVGIA